VPALPREYAGADGLPVENSLTEYPKPYQENKTQGHHREARIMQKDQPASRVELFVSSSRVSSVSDPGNSLVFGQPFVYLVDHRQGNHIGNKGSDSAEESSEDDGPRNVV
jgi:hypothetical protein